jgi:hypothetical protein
MTVTYYKPLGNNPRLGKGGAEGNSFNGMVKLDDILDDIFLGYGNTIVEFKVSYLDLKNRFLIWSDEYIEKNLW